MDERSKWEDLGGDAQTPGTVPATAPDWERAHAELLRLSRERAHLDADEGHWLLRALRSGAHAELGYASFAEYIERLFGYSPRWTAEKLRVAEGLERLPELTRALANGDIPWSVARELTRVAMPETETEWLAATREKTTRDVERLVSGHRPGSRPDDRRDPSAARHVLRFEISSVAMAAFREALAKIRRDADAPLDDEAALLLIARQILGGSNDPGRSSYQMALTVCEHCKDGTVQGRGEGFSVERADVEMATCDAQSVSMVADTEAAHTHVGHAEFRAKQSVSPSVRRFVHHRDAGRCQVPGCRHAIFVDVHHVDPKAEGGSHDSDNLVTLCGAHHRAVHRGKLVVAGRVSTGLVFHHSDGSPYGSRSASPRTAEVHAKAFRALRALGFRESEARHALARVATHVGHDRSVEDVLRQALAELTRPFERRSSAVSGRKAA